MTELNYKDLYEEKCLQFEEISEQFNELQEQSTLIMNDLEDEIRDLKKKKGALETEVKDLKEKKKIMVSTIERELNNSQKQKNQFKDKFLAFQKKVIELEIINEDLERDLRATEFTLSEYEQRTEQTMQELAILQSQLQETTATSQEQVTRLRQQLKETEDELFAMHNRIKKKSEIESQVQIVGVSDKSSELKPQSQGKQILKGEKIAENFGNNLINESGVENEQNISGNPEKANGNPFKKALSDIRNYLSEIDQRKKQIRTKVFISA